MPTKSYLGCYHCRKTANGETPSPGKQADGLLERICHSPLRCESDASKYGPTFMGIGLFA